MSDTILKVENLSKQYRLGLIGTGTLSHDLNRWFHKIKGKEDPYLKVGEVNDRTHKTESNYVWALRDINFEVKRGEVLGIIGKNGAGKSTLLKILSKVTGPTTGSIKAKGRIASLLEVGTGFHPELTGRENIYLNGAILGMSHQEIRKKFDEIVDFSGVERYIDTPVKRYSSGMYVRLAFAVAAHLEPEILVVDEVLAVGDIEFQKKCLEKMDTDSKTGKTILFVSHDLNAIEKLCPKSILLDSGQLVAHGSTTKIIEKYLNARNKGVAEYRHPEDRKKSMNLRKVSVLNEKGKPSTELNHDKPFSFQIDYDINSPVKGCYIWLTLKTLNDKIVFQTLDTDSNQELYTYRDKGKYTNTLEIPGNLINEGLYKVTIGLTEAKFLHNFDRVDALSFRINVDQSSLNMGGERTGVIRPILHWDTKKNK